MKKREFLAVLQRELYNLPQNELKEQLSFYSEMIDDGMDEGLNEDEAVAKIGSISDILSQMHADRSSDKITDKGVVSTPLSKSVADRKKLSAGEITLIILSSPIWLPIIAAFFAVVLSAFVSLYVVFISLCAVMASLVITAVSVAWVLLIVLCAVELVCAVVVLATPVMVIIYLVRGLFAPSVFALGAGFTLAGVFYFLWSTCTKSVLLTIRLSKSVSIKTFEIIKVAFLQSVIITKIIFVKTVEAWKKWRNLL